jgi:hypothetical protein
MLPSKKIVVDLRWRRPWPNSVDKMLSRIHFFPHHCLVNDLVFPTKHLNRGSVETKEIAYASQQLRFNILMSCLGAAIRSVAKIPMTL